MRLFILMALALVATPALAQQPPVSPEIEALAQSLMQAQQREVGERVNRIRAERERDEARAALPKTTPTKDAAP